MRCLAAALTQSRSRLDTQRLMAVVWPTGRGRAGDPYGWRALGIEMA